VSSYENAERPVWVDHEQTPPQGQWRLSSLLGWTRGAVAQSLAQFRANWLRTLLTLLGIVFGVGSVIAMGSIGEGAQREILATIDAMGADVAQIQSAEIEESKIGDIVNDSVGLHRSDAVALRNALPMADALAYRKSYEVRVTDLKVPRHEIKLFAISRGFARVQRLSLAQGRDLVGADHDERRRVALLGAGLARRAFGSARAALGRRIRLDYAYFEVVGVLGARGEVSAENLPVDPNLHDQAILVPFATATEELSPPKAYGEIDLISLKVRSTRETLVAKQIIEPTLRALHGGINDFTVVAPEEILQQRQKAQAVLNIVLVCIAAISLIVGGIGVMNIMLANIMERIGEIGLRRAVGARKRDIRNQFLLEAVLICILGGAIGVVVGLTISYVVAWAVDLPIAFDWTSVTLAFFISLAVGVVFGLMPALRAANINPIEALQNG